MTRPPALVHFERRFIFPAVTALAVLLIILSWITIHQMSDNLNQELLQKGHSRVKNLAELSRVSILLEDKEALAKLVIPRQTRDPDEAGMAVWNEKGQLLAKAGAIEERVATIALIAPPGTPPFRQGTISVFVSPVADSSGHRIGSVALALSRERIISMVRFSAFKLICGTVIAFILIASIMQWLLTRIRILAEAESQRASDLQKAYTNLQTLQEQLVRSEKMAALGQLASGVGHELRNPLSAIRNAIYYIRDGLKENPVLESDPMLSEMMDLTDREIKGATRIITDLLDFSRVMRLILESTDINKTLQHVKESIEIPPNVCVVENYGDLPKAMVDPERIRQVFVNLTTNAVQAMAKGGQLIIQTRVTEDNNKRSWVVVDIKDTGAGISPEMKEKIFEPFFTTKAKGTGLGLPICKGIVQAHGGTIAVVSTVGQGTTFSISIPTEAYANVA